MSYINDALKKAQQEKEGPKEGPYGPYGAIISHRAGRPSRPARRWAPALAMAAASAVTVVTLWVGLFLFTERPADMKQRQSAEVPTAESSSPAASVPQGVPGPGAAPPAAPETPDGSGSPADANALYRDALAAQRRNETAQAEDLYKRALGIDPAHVHAMNNLGVIYMGQNRHAEAISLFERALLQKRQYADPYYNLACLYAQRGDAGRALANLKSAIDIDAKLVEWARQDRDLANIRSTEAFRKMMENPSN